MFIEIHAETVTTHENPRTGDRTEDQQQATTYRIDLAELARLLRPLAELILAPAAITNGRHEANHGFVVRR